jgi:hypothetical protein
VTGARINPEPRRETLSLCACWDRDQTTNVSLIEKLGTEETWGWCLPLQRERGREEEMRIYLHYTVFSFRKHFDSCQRRLRLVAKKTKHVPSLLED